MIKQLGFVATALAAGMAIVGGTASAAGTTVADYPHSIDHNDQLGLANLQNLDVIHNLNVVAGVCDNNVNVLGVQVPIRDVAEGIAIPVLSPGATEAEGTTPDNCASGLIQDGGTLQGN
ncbi:hypothetical protein P3102_07135 [Amycolatopsis sp. QT-25]|uniref:hypothetical protein n=1 Tax=Amycolatopsis sp. QT-25 TaxID=3034022 RepID=UPI0023EB04BC|nr:hypothetical protein [Amycolatopsis sp. QT-25]WET81002.1 hypothetical protein P3102_07135 [Amycolatopsis sp. QT-25]